jgi:hypothetical protein
MEVREVQVYDYANVEVQAEYTMQKAAFKKTPSCIVNQLSFHWSQEKKKLTPFTVAVYRFFDLYRHLLVLLFDIQDARIDRQSLYKHTVLFIQTQTLHVAIYAFAFGALNMFACQFCSVQSLFFPVRICSISFVCPSH